MLRAFFFIIIIATAHIQPQTTISLFYRRAICTETGNLHRNVRFFPWSSPSSS